MTPLELVYAPGDHSSGHPYQINSHTHAESHKSCFHGPLALITPAPSPRTSHLSEAISSALNDVSDIAAGDQEEEAAFASVLETHSTSDWRTTGGGVATAYFTEKAAQAFLRDAL